MEKTLRLLGRRPILAIILVAILITIISLIIRPSEATDIVGKAASHDFLSRLYLKMAELNVKNLKSKNHYLSMHWPDDGETHEYITKNFDAALQAFRKSNKVIFSGESVEITLRQAPDNRKLLVVFPMPHISIYLHTMYLNKMNEYFKDYDILIVNGNPGAIGEKQLSLKAFQMELNTAFRKVHKTFLSGYENYHLHIICYATLYLEEFLRTNLQLFQKRSFYAPMVINRIKNIQFAPNEIVPSGTPYRYSDMHFQLSMIVMDFAFPIVLPKGEDILNKKLISEAFSLYENGFDRSLLKGASVILAETDEIVPHQNSAPESFQASYIIPESNHVTPFYSEQSMVGYMEMLRKSLEN